MGTLFMVRKDRKPTLLTERLTQAQIRDLFNSALARATGSGSATRWVGPLPRITRTGTALSREQIRVAWLLDVANLSPATIAQGTVTVADLARNIGVALDEVMDPIDPTIPASGGGAVDRPAPPAPNWEPASVTPYSQVANGPVAWWSEGTASRTLTQEAPLSFSTERPENPIGPDSTDTRPGGSPAEDAARSRQTVDSVLSIVKFATVAAIVVGIAYTIGQVAPSITLWSARRTGDSATRRELAAARPNPRSRKRR